MDNLKKRFSCLFLTILFLLFFFPLSTYAAVTYSYDANGNMISDGQYCYIYNDANQVSKVKNCSLDQLIVEYFYNFNGSRIVKKEYENGTLKHTIYSPDKGYESKKIEGGATENTTYYFANDELVARKNPDGSKTFYHTDHLGSTSVLTNSSGSLVEQTTYFPYGEVRSGGVQSKYQFTGQEKDINTGLNYYGARYYNSHIARFTQPDSLLPDLYDPQLLNRYAYTRNNPLKYKDPTGNYLESAIDIGFIAWDLNDIKSDPKNAWNYAALVADAGGLLLPGATGGRVAVKALEHADDAPKFFKGLKPEILSKINDINLLRGIDSKRYLTEVPEIGWKVGDYISNLTSKGLKPAWSTIRQRFWKNEAYFRSNLYTDKQLERMVKGLAPQYSDINGILKSFELHHTPAQREGGKFLFDIETQLKHMFFDPLRR